MCGRFAIANPKFKRLEEVLGTSFPALSPRYNIAPTQQIPVIVQAGAVGYELISMRWGLVPHWCKEPNSKFSTFNARVESIEEKPAFRDSFRSRRCIIPASGFYEWKTSGGRKQPYYFTDAKSEGLAFAGLWDVWQNKDSKIISCTILVGTPNELLSRVHDRMPAILADNDYAAWLNPKTASKNLHVMLRPYPAELMRGWPVSSDVGFASNNSPTLIKPITI